MAVVLASSVVSLTGCNSDGPFSASDIVFFTVTDLTIGMGARATTGDVLTFRYVSWLYDSDESDNKGQQIDAADVPTFLLGAGTVLGLDQGLVGMRVGGKRRLTVPPELAFGQPGAVPAGSAIVSEVELLDVQPVMTDSAPFTIIDLEVGTGTEAANGDVLNVFYSAWFYDATAADNKGLFFEASSGNGILVTLGAGQVIPGWDMGLVGMRVGGERRLIIPPELAYGAAGRAPLIPPNATVLFDITLQAIQ